MRNSERSTFRRCGFKWDWAYNRRLAPEVEKGALSFGSLVHEALAVYYPPGVKRGPHPAATFEKLYHDQQRKFAQWDDEGNRIDALELGVSMLTEYVALYGADDTIDIIQSEIPMQIDVYDKKQRYLCTWVGRGDAAYRNRITGRIGFLEHKTAKSIEEELRINSGYGEQGLSYWWAGDITFHHRGWLKEDEHVDHVLFNWLRKALPDDRPRDRNGNYLNKPTKDALLVACADAEITVPKKATMEVLTGLLEAEGVEVAMYGAVSKVQQKPLFHRWPLPFGPGEMATINDRIRKEAWMMAETRAGRIPLLKNPTKDCVWDCPFKEACELHEMGADWESVLELEFTTWSPYEEHELVEEKA